MAREKGFCQFVKKLNIALIGACVAALVLCYIFTISQYEADTITEEISPYAVVNLEDGSKEYLFDLRKYDYRYSGIMFYTSHQKIEAYSEGGKIYSFDKTGGIWSSSVGSAYHFVDIHKKMANVAVVVSPVYSVVADVVPTFYIGSGYNMYNDIMVKSMPRFIASMLIFVISVFLVIYYRLMRKKLELGEELVYLGYFSLFIGLWTLVETDVFTLIFKNKIVELVVPYVCLMFVVPPLILFFHNYLSFKTEKITNILVSLSLINFIVLTILHFAKIAEYRETIPFIHLMLLI